MTEAPRDYRRGKKRLDGDGSVYQRHSPVCDRPTSAVGKSKCKCPWQGSFVLHYKSNPKPGGAPLAVRKKVSASTESGAAAAVRELRERLRGDELPADGKSMTVEKWMTHWFTKIAPRNTKPLTIVGYNAKVNHYIIPLLGHHRLDRLTPEHIEDAWDVLRDSGNPTLAEPKPLSANTIHQTHRILSAALKVAIQRKKLRVNPAGSDSMKSPPKEEHEIVPMSEDEIDKVLAACRGQWNAARWSVALALGLRQGEALGLRWEDVDLDEGVVNVRQTLMRLSGKGLVFGTPKSAAGRRSVVMPASLHAALKAHRTAQTAKRLEVGSHWTDTGLVFTMPDGRAIDPSLDANRWRSLLKSAGVPHYRLHTARHSAATLMLAQGVDIRVAMKKDAAGKMDQAGRWA